MQTAKASDGSLYNSLVNNNQGNDPVSSPSEWGTTGIAQTAGDIKTLYLSNADTNNFDDAAESKLAGIEAGAKDDQTGAEIKAAYEVETSAFTDAQFTKLGTIEDNAKDDQTPTEIQTDLKGMADADKEIVFSEPEVGEHKVYGLHRNAAGNPEYDYEDVAES